MPNMTWEEEYNITKEFLDTLDIQKIFQEENPLESNRIADLIYLIENHVKENNIEDYSITVNDVEYEKMKNKIEWLEHRIEDIKRTLKDIEERY